MCKSEAVYIAIDYVNLGSNKGIICWGIDFRASEHIWLQYHLYINSSSFGRN